MMVFWLATIAMVAAALAFVIPPLIRSTKDPGPSRQQANINIYRERVRELEQQQESGALDAAQIAHAREELDREMLAQISDSPDEQQASAQARKSHTLRALAIAVALPLLALGIYTQVSAPETRFGAPAPLETRATVGQAEQPSVAQMVAQLEQRLRAQPDDIRGWLMLGRSYSIMNRPEDARAAFAQALERAPDNPEAMVSYAEVLTKLNQGSLDGEPIALVNRALAIEADSPRALWLSGIHALNQGIPAQALSTWQKILDGGKLNASASAQVVQAMQSIRLAVADAQGSAPRKTEDGVAANTATTGASVRANVSLSEELRASITGTETVFVFARASDGPPMPLAVQRFTAAQLPLSVVLDDSDAMAPELALSRFESVVVTARISRTGTPRAAPGDLQGVSAEMTTRDAPPVDLVIDQRVE